LGRGAEPGTAAVGRTFCNLPKGGKWKEELNDKARDEVTAHMSKCQHLENSSINMPREKISHTNVLQTCSLPLSTQATEL
jgi:hypothetical protein